MKQLSIRYIKQGLVFCLLLFLLLGSAFVVKATEESGGTASETTEEQSKQSEQLEELENQRQETLEEINDLKNSISNVQGEINELKAEKKFYSELYQSAG